MNKSINIDSPIFLFFKKHLCPQCKTLLSVKRLSQVVNRKSPEAKNFDFSCGDSSLSGDVQFFYYMLNCEKCNAFYSVNEIKKHEKDLKKLKNEKLKQKHQSKDK